ncbi:MAG: phage major capsid protein [Spirochaetales bacterium]|nr:phage major capsid protein [Spirochaetales bacterium]
MEIKDMMVEELLERRASIAEEVNAEGADLDALEAEVKSINEELEARKEAEAQRNEIRAQVAEGAGEVRETISTEEVKKMTNEEIRGSHEYNVAYANYIKTENDSECRALLTENVNGDVPVPSYVEDRIRTAWQRNGLMDLVRKTYIRGNLRIGFELSATAATVHTESTSPIAEETLALGIVEMVPASIKKFIRISDEAMDLGGEEFLDYIYDELAYQIAKKAQSELINKITALTASATTNAVGVGVVAGTPSVGLVANALGSLSDEAANPVIVMNKGSWAQFKAAQYAASYAVDPFEGLPVHFDNSLPAYTSATTLASGTAWMVVGDFGVGAHANFPNGDEIRIKFDDLSEAEADLVRIVGREYVGLGIVADHAFCKIVK